jgi:hypothetical protein
MSINAYETPKSSLVEQRNEKASRAQKIIIYIIGMSFIIFSAFKLIFAVLFLLKIIEPAPDFVLPNVTNIIDRTIVSGLCALSGFLLILKKRAAVFMLAITLVATICVKIILFNQGDAYQYVMGPEGLSIIGMLIVLIYIYNLLRKGIIN